MQTSFSALENVASINTTAIARPSERIYSTSVKKYPDFSFDQLNLYCHYPRTQGMVTGDRQNAQITDLGTIITKKKTANILHSLAAFFETKFITYILWHFPQKWQSLCMTFLTNFSFLIKISFLASNPSLQPSPRLTSKPSR